MNKSQQETLIPQQSSGEVTGCHDNSMMYVHNDQGVQRHPLGSIAFTRNESSIMETHEHYQVVPFNQELAIMTASPAGNIKYHTLQANDNWYYNSDDTGNINTTTETSIHNFSVQAQSSMGHNPITTAPSEEEITYLQWIIDEYVNGRLSWNIVEIAIGLDDDALCLSSPLVSSLPPINNELSDLADDYNYDTINKPNTDSFLSIAWICFHGTCSNMHSRKEDLWRHIFSHHLGYPTKYTCLMHDEEHEAHQYKDRSTRGHDAAWKHICNCWSKYFTRQRGITLVPFPPPSYLYSISEQQEGFLCNFGKCGYTTDCKKQLKKHVFHEHDNKNKSTLAQPCPHCGQHIRRTRWKTIENHILSCVSTKLIFS
ncbi:hypothetical protein BDA99DRAFT_543561 [Phascolomyces articulosus]|uniref:C2H2-type domain-containing protein n=1 Tax=Phascolomyces articulosus TaxID=60185 RepID=A0AAD5JN36_9FUNG|nr:hypothetical protein BDA99DRAFT_543561 [Phascolomyces articulosus]